ARRKYSRGRVEGDLDVGRQRCPEETIDALLVRGESEPLLAEEVLDVAKECGLSQVETEQLFEYLVSKGIDLVGWQLSQALWSVCEEDGAMEDKERWGFFADPGVQILLEDMRRFKRLTASEEFRLARLAEERNQEASWRLIEGNLWRVLRTATRYVGMGLDFLDLFQEGCIGLIKAVSRFDWRSGNRFFTYGSWWVLQGIRTAITSEGRTIRLPAHTLEALRRLQMTTEHLCQVHEREPTTEEIACEMGLPVKKVRELQALAQPTLSLEAIMVEWEEVGAHSGWFLGEYGALPDDGDLSQSQLRETVATVLKELKPRQQEVLRLRFGLDGQEPQTLDQVARRFGLTRERIRQIEAQALKRLRHPKRSNRLRDFLG
ncbi:MAG: sigma-70 family RNA polymerase sigma factor, partial [Bacillota bacterium]